VINVDKEWPKWSNKDTFKGYAVHGLYKQPSYMKEEVGERARCGAVAANLYTNDESKVTCGRCRRK
tara:strand:- start:197 stop:394 length:198 start_codon:yes stop_codon:yes gene_type:complete